jgi:UDP-glucose 4-epimerase
MPSPESHEPPGSEPGELNDPFRDFYTGRKILITGGLGFVGSNLAIRLVQCGAEVTVLDSLEPHGGGLRNIASVRDHVDVTICDMRDADALEIAVRDQDFIFNLAGHVSHADSMLDPRLDLDCNCVSALNLVEACRKHAPGAQLLYASTRQVYGRPRRLPVAEDHPAVPVDINGIHKLAAEHYHLLYDSVYGVRSTVLRLTNTYGPRQKISDNRHGVAAVFLHNALCGTAIELYAGGRQRRDFNYVDDVVDAMLRAMARPCCRGRVFNLGAAEAHSLCEFVNLLREYCSFEVRHVPFPEDAKLIDIGDYYGDYSAFRAATGWEPKTRLEDGLRRTVAFYRAHRGNYW